LLRFQTVVYRLRYILLSFSLRTIQNHLHLQFNRLLPWLQLPSSELNVDNFEKCYLQSYKDL
jgi:hypothetical protein